MKAGRRRGVWGSGEVGLAEHSAGMEGIPQHEVGEVAEEPNHVRKKSDPILSVMGTMSRGH